MNTIIKKSFLALGAIALLAGCDENNWNDKLDGFEVPEPGTSVETLNYTLTPADYNKISSASLYTNFAASLGQEEQNKLIGATGSFSTEAEALQYIPKFLRDSTNTFFALSNGSAVKVTYNVAAKRARYQQACRANHRFGR